LDLVVNLLPHLLNGISLGLLFALIALGFMLIVGVMEVINLAHGSLFALGAYVCIFLLSQKFPFYAAVLLAPLLVARRFARVSMDEFNCLHRSIHLRRFLLRRDLIPLPRRCQDHHRRRSNLDALPETDGGDDHVLLTATAKS